MRTEAKTSSKREDLKRLYEMSYMTGLVMPLTRCEVSIYRAQKSYLPIQNNQNPL